jgi:hypothetical protein
MSARKALRFSKPRRSVLFTFLYTLFVCLLFQYHFWCLGLCNEGLYTVSGVGDSNEL